MKDLLKVRGVIEFSLLISLSTPLLAMDRWGVTEGTGSTRPLTSLVSHSSYRPVEDDQVSQVAPSEVTMRSMESFVSTGGRRHASLPSLSLDEKRNPLINTAYTILRQGRDINGLAPYRTSFGEASKADVLSLSKEVTILMEAIFKGNYAAAVWILSHGGRVDVKTSNGNEAIHYACMADNVDMVTLCLDNNADIEAVNILGRTPLNMSTDTRIVKLLVDRGADPHALSPEEGITPFIRAAQSFNLDLLKILNVEPVLVDVPDRAGHTALYWASKRGKLEPKIIDCIVYLIQQGADLAHMETGKLPPLFFVVDQNLASVAKALIDRGLNPHEIVHETGETPFIRAAKKGHLDVLKNFNIDPALIDTPDSKGHTALYWASSCSHLPCLEYLIRAGAGLDQLNTEKIHPLLYFLEHKASAEVLRALLYRGLNPHEILPKRDETPFIRAAKRGDLDMLKILNINPALIDTPDSEGHTALYWASNFDNPEEKNVNCAIYMLEQGADRMKVGKGFAAFLKVNDLKSINCLNFERLENPFAQSFFFSFLPQMGFKSLDLSRLKATEKGMDALERVLPQTDIEDLGLPDSRHCLLHAVPSSMVKILRFTRNSYIYASDMEVLIQSNVTHIDFGDCEDMLDETCMKALSQSKVTDLSNLGGVRREYQSYQPIDPSRMVYLLSFCPKLKINGGDLNSWKESERRKIEREERQANRGNGRYW